MISGKYEVAVGAGNAGLCPPPGGAALDEIERGGEPASQGIGDGLPIGGR
jgi:hypothetical protein